jgi:nucleoside-diphosphate-sugar epimerase
MPSCPKDVESLDLLLSEPTPLVVETLSKLNGDILILGVAGKMGVTLARMASRALAQAGQRDRRVIGVARFSNPREQQKLESWGIQTIRCDLLDQKALTQLPDAPTVIYMAGMKFGATGNESLTWAMNTFLPGIVCQRFRNSRIAAFSTGNIYGLYPLHGGGATERDTPVPVGEYSMSCLGRERMFEHFSKTNGTPVSILRVNYACELRYGVLVDLARSVWTGQSVDLAMASFNIIWQADANAMSLASLANASSPPFYINIAGPELMSVRGVLETFGRIMKREPKMHGAEARDATISNGQLGHRLYGYPRVTPNQMIEWIAEWVMAGGESLNKPTHFETRDGKY